MRRGKKVIFFFDPGCKKSVTKKREKVGELEEPTEKAHAIIPIT